MIVSFSCGVTASLNVTLVASHVLAYLQRRSGRVLKTCPPSARPLFSVSWRRSGLLGADPQPAPCDDPVLRPLRLGARCRLVKWAGSIRAIPLKKTVRPQMSWCWRKAWTP